MYLVLSIIIVFAGAAIYIGSAFAVINTLLALYYLYPELTETLSKIFKNN